MRNNEADEVLGRFEEWVKVEVEELKRANQVQVLDAEAFELSERGRVAGVRDPALCASGDLIRARLGAI